MILAPIRFAIFLATLAATPAQAGFHFEGLEPFSTRACNEAPMANPEPVIIPNGPRREGSPSAYNDGGIPRFSAPPCSIPTGKFGTGTQESLPLRLPAQE